jgi:hypothetical protein
MTAVHLLKILRAANALVATPERWTVRNFAETAVGKWVPVGSEHASRFNLAGAVIKSAGASVREAMREFTTLLSDAPAELHPRHWAQAQGLTRTQAVELLGWAMVRLEGIIAEQTQLHGAGSRTLVDDAKVSQ